MPRTGITKAQIQAAIDALQSRGERVTKTTVRRQLGDTGSNGTITPYLREWRAGRQFNDGHHHSSGLSPPTPGALQPGRERRQPSRWR